MTRVGSLSCHFTYTRELTSCPPRRLVCTRRPLSPPKVCDSEKEAHSTIDHDRDSLRRLRLALVGFLIGAVLLQVVRVIERRPLAHILWTMSEVERSRHRLEDHLELIAPDHGSDQQRGYYCAP